MLLFLFKIVHLCCPLIFNYRLKYTQNIIQLFQLSIVFVVIIIKYLYIFLRFSFFPSIFFYTIKRSKVSFENKFSGRGR